MAQVTPVTPAGFTALLLRKAGATAVPRGYVKRCLAMTVSVYSQQRAGRLPRAASLRGSWVSMAHSVLGLSAGSAADHTDTCQLGGNVTSPHDGEDWLGADLARER